MSVPGRDFVIGANAKRTKKVSVHVDVYASVDASLSVIREFLGYLNFMNTAIKI